MIFRQLIDKESSTYTYLLADPVTREAILIDPVREQYQRDVQILKELDLTLKYTLETHMHADHVTASGLFRQNLGSQSVVSVNAGAPCADRHVKTGDEIYFGEQRLSVRETPGHTNGCVSYHWAQKSMIFTGDTLFIRGCGRTDFQQGSSERLYESVHNQIFSLSDDTLIYPGHDYKGRTVSTVREERTHNPRLGQGKSKSEFVAIMAGLKLGFPKKMAEAVPANLQCGLPSESVENVDTPLSPIAADSWAPIQRRQGIPEIEVSWVRDNQDKIQIVDVREVSEHTVLPPISSADCVPQGQIHMRLSQWSHETPIVVVCQSGRRSARVSGLLEQHGFERVASMIGGMLAWRNSADSCG